MIWDIVFYLLLISSLGGLAPYLWKWFKLRKVRAAEAELPKVLHEIALILKKGYSIEYALKAMYEGGSKGMKDYFKKVFREIRKGKELSQSLLDNLGILKESRPVSFSIRLIAKGIEQGSPLAELLEQLAISSRRVISLDRERKSRALNMAALNLIMTPIMLAALSTVITGMGENAPVILFFKDAFKIYGLVVGIAAFLLSYFAAGGGKERLTLLPIGAFLGYAPIYLVLEFGIGFV
jgi:pilus assembly protein TadC